MVQSQHNSLNISISKVSNISTLGKVLTDQAVGIFIGSVLLSGLWMSKMYIGFQFFGQGSVFGKFLAIATGDGQSHNRFLLAFADDRICFPIPKPILLVHNHRALVNPYPLGNLSPFYIAAIAFPPLFLTSEMPP